MFWMLVSVVTLSAVSGFFGVDFSLAPGLSLKNLVLYAAAGLILVDAIVRRRERPVLGRVILAIGIFVTYALLTWIYNSFLSHPEGFDKIAQGISLKSNLIDYFVFFLVFFYGVKDKREAIGVVKAILLAVGLANLFTVTQVAGLTGFGHVEYGNNDDYEGGRVHGAFGHANETGALIVMLLPFYVSAIETTRGFERALWYGMLGASIAMFLLTGSRGGLSSLLFGVLITVWLLKRHLSRARTVYWVALSLLLAVPALAFFGGSYFRMMVGRIQSQTLSGSGDVTSGRFELWLQGINEMLDAPWTLITGFGWGTWLLHGFPYVAHNQYLWTLFELGLLGLLAYLIIWAHCLLNGLNALRRAPEGDRAWSLAFVVGCVGILVSMAFENLYEPFLYIWPLMGAMTRFNVSVIAASPKQQSVSKTLVGGSPSRPVRTKAHDEASLAEGR